VGNGEASEVDFNNILRKAYMIAYPKSTKNTVKPSVFFSLLGSARVKAVHKMLVKLTPDRGQEVQSHRGDLTRVPRPVGDGQARHDHVSVADRFNLLKEINSKEILQDLEAILKKKFSLQNVFLRLNLFYRIVSRGRFCQRFMHCFYMRRYRKHKIYSLFCTFGISGRKSLS